LRYQAQLQSLKEVAIIMQYKIRWTIAMKVGVIITVLILFILILLVNSIVTLNKIQTDLSEIANVDVPLAESSGEIERTQLERHLVTSAFLSNYGVEKKNIHLDKSRINDLSRKLNNLLDRESAVAERGLKSKRGKKFEKVAMALKTLKNDLTTIDQGLHQCMDRFSAGDFSDSQSILLINRKNEAFEKDIRNLVQTVATLTEQKTQLADKHEKLFKMVNVSLGFIGASLGTLLGALIVAGIRTNIFQLSKRIEEATAAINGHGDIPAGEADIINSSDELAGLSKELSKLFSSLSNDLTRRDRLSKQLNELATSDYLTGSFNRFKWDKDQNFEIERAKRQGTELSLILMDIDHFKRVNDTFGHDVGDATLVEVVRITENTIRIIDSLYRIGGEEFAVLLPGTTIDEAIVLAERIRKAIDIQDIKHVGHVTVSLGVSRFNDSVDDAEQFIKRADQAMYRSKETGRNKISIG